MGLGVEHVCSTDGMHQSLLEMQHLCVERAVDILNGHLHSTQIQTHISDTTAHTVCRIPR